MVHGRKAAIADDHRDYDPYQDLSHLHTIKTDYDLASSTITPFNTVQYIQTMFNPLSEGIDREMITVQLYNPAVNILRPDDRANQMEKDAQRKSSYFRA
jgi:hypothetical protein